MVLDCFVFDLSSRKNLWLWSIYQLEGALFLSSLSWGIYVVHKNNLTYWIRRKIKRLEVLGIDPSTSRMLSERSTIWATPPCWWLLIVWQRISHYFWSRFYIPSIVKQLAKIITICAFTRRLLYNWTGQLMRFVENHKALEIQRSLVCNTIGTPWKVIPILRIWRV